MRIYEEPWVSIDCENWFSGKCLCERCILDRAAQKSYYEVIDKINAAIRDCYYSNTARDYYHCPPCKERERKKVKLYNDYQIEKRRINQMPKFVKSLQQQILEKIKLFLERSNPPNVPSTIKNIYSTLCQFKDALDVGNAEFLEILNILVGENENEK